ncbi:MAG: DUF1611 domain-containing protein [Acidobacteriota bacterium]
MLERDQVLAIYMEGHRADKSGKMGEGVLRYSSNPIACVIDSGAADRDAAEVMRIPRHCPIVGTITEARALGAQVLVLGIAPPGGRIPAAWLAAIDEAVAAGFSLVNGLHDLLAPRYQTLEPGQWVWDVRVEPPDLGIASGAAAGSAARRVLLVGTDMAVGKMTAALELHAAALARGLRSHFVATGQIGITIVGRGVPLDAIRLDFASGAIEREVLAAGDAEIVFVEGQGSLLHPASSATLPLLRGTMPTHLVLCHRAGQAHLERVPSVTIPPLAQVIELYRDLAAACGAFPRPLVPCVALNTSHVASDGDARRAADAIERDLGLPCDDPLRHGAGRLLESLLSTPGRKYGDAPRTPMRRARKARD